MDRRRYNGPYTGEHLNRVAFPLGGIGTGMICLEGTGGFSHTSLRHKPDILAMSRMFAAVCVKGSPNVARILEGPVPDWKVMFPWGQSGNGGSGTHFGLPRFRRASFEPAFPFATVDLADDDVPVTARITGWSPFTPPDVDSSSLPVAAVEYRLTNPTHQPLEVVWSFHAANIMGVKGENGASVGITDGGFVLRQAPTDDKPHLAGAMAAWVDGEAATVNPAWFRGGWFDALTLVWKSIADGDTPTAAACPDDKPSPGGSVYVPMTLDPGQERTVRLHLAWYVPRSDLYVSSKRGAFSPDDHKECCCEPPTYEPWYAGQFADVEQVARTWSERYDELRQRSATFRDCFHDTTVAPEVVEAVAANLTILKSPTVLRQTDGRMWAYEGCCDGHGCCVGSCTHVWNYAQAVCHLFPSLERSLRRTEFNENQDERGHQGFRAELPIRPLDSHAFHAAADGQLGGIMKVYREWRISGDTDWLGEIWPKVRQSLDYCIATWDPDRVGLLVEPHHNTYDIEFWGPDGMCSSIYLGALTAATRMAEALGDEASPYAELRDTSKAAIETELFDGEYFIQKIQWTGLRAGDPTEGLSFHTDYSPEAVELMRTEGPKYQYGTGCLSDGVIGAWLAQACGLGEILDASNVASHLAAVHTHNFRSDLTAHANPQRPTYALGDEAGLLLCSWPKGGALSLPFVYSDEVWTGIEYQVASHLMMAGRVDEGLQIVRACRDRYDGRVRNPFDEYECGHWYARAMASYALLQGLTGIRYDAVDRVLHLAPSIAGDFRSFLATAGGYGTAGVRDGKPFVGVVDGTIDVDDIEYVPYEG
jgi:uncharacterized protein (DUF608 family)